MKKKQLLVMVAMMLVVAMVSVAGTVAWLTAQSSVVNNTFSVGDVQITLDETDVDLYGVKDGETRVKKNEYKLIPGHTYTKDPQVHVVKGSEPSYVRMFVTITDIDDVLKVFGNDFLPQYFVEGWDSTKWVSTQIIDKSVAGQYTYEFRYSESVDARNANADVDLLPLFTKIIIPDTVTKEQIATLNEMEIKVVAQAIQIDGFGGDQAAAWAKAPVIDWSKVD